MMSTFGVTLEAIEARELINKAKSYSDGECAEYLDKAGCCMAGLDKTPDKNVKDFAKLYKAYTDYVTEVESARYLPVAGRISSRISVLRYAPYCPF